MSKTLLKTLGSMTLISTGIVIGVLAYQNKDRINKALRQKKEYFKFKSQVYKIKTKYYVKRLYHKLLASQSMKRAKNRLGKVLNPKNNAQKQKWTVGQDILPFLKSRPNTH